MFAAPASSANRSALPPRTVSLGATQAAYFNQIEEELRDVKRVHSHGQEEDLRLALSRTISRVEEISSMLKEAYKVQTDIQTELTLAKSNLQLALANNEMLEDALKRDGQGHSKDVGWRRWSAKEQREREMAAMSRRLSSDSLHSDFLPSPSPASPTPSPAEPRFFRFRFGSTTPGTLSPRIPGSASPNLGNLGAPGHVSHLASASLPSLIGPRDKDKELEDLTALLEQEKRKHKAALAAKEALEAELESLSQALFEEANKMVAVERMRLAETEEELKETQAEKQALKSALRLVESQNSRSNSRANSMSPTLDRRPLLQASQLDMNLASSVIVVNSPPSSTPSSPRPPSQEDVEDDIVHSRAAAPPALDLPEVGLANPNAKPSPSPGSDSSSLALPQPDDTPSSSSSSSSPTPLHGQFGFNSARPLSYFEGEESPWADVRSTTPVTAAF